MKIKNTFLGKNRIKMKYYFSKIQFSTLNFSKAGIANN